MAADADMAVTTAHGTKTHASGLKKALYFIL